MPVEVNSSERGPGNTYLMSAACPLRVYQVNTSVHSSYILHVNSLEALLVFRSALQDAHEKGAQFCSCKKWRDTRPLVKDRKITPYRKILSVESSLAEFLQPSVRDWILKSFYNPFQCSTSHRDYYSLSSMISFEIYRHSVFYNVFRNISVQEALLPTSNILGLL